MLKFLCKYALSFFTKDKIGVLIRMLFAHVGKHIADQILDADNQSKAYEFAKEVSARNDMTNEQKAKAFNEKMRGYAKSVEKPLSECAINCLRELAVSAVKGEQPGA